MTSTPTMFEHVYIIAFWTHVVNKVFPVVLYYHNKTGAGPGLTVWLDFAIITL